MNRSFWEGKRVFLTGHTGFKGSYACLWLSSMGAEVTGYALEPNTTPNLSELVRVEEDVSSVIGDVRDLDRLSRAMKEAKPQIVIHMAAQPLVSEGYTDPVGTYETNVMGTVHVLEAVRQCESIKAVVNVTTDKCYENRESARGYREDEPMGGYDPYSSSKGCSELVTAAYRQSFFPPESYARHGVAISTARAGNVIGFGDWAENRLVPDFFRAMEKNQPVVLRNPGATRPWQYVLEPLHGYFTLAQTLYEQGSAFCGAWNFGPEDGDTRDVEWIIKRLCELWGGGASYRVDGERQFHETNCLKLDISKAKMLLDWKPRWDLNTALEILVDRHKRYLAGENVKALCLETIKQYM